MFQTSFFPQHRLSIIHPPEMTVSVDLLFETELLFAWGDMMDPYYVKKILERFVPYAPAVITGYSCKAAPEWRDNRFSLQPEQGGVVLGFSLIGITNEDFEILDRIEQVPVHHQREKVLCRMGSLERIVYIYIRQGALLAE